ncbi:putative hydrolase of the HAD superfamily [Kribbella steppae]|uniref:Putative hydrolase of the HAD superfamily n=1 Tax=Kribbella steppae TaxID=2512223 RepID=A0A4R2HGZ5_9ACTN|nr:HAD-IA family hydrolase [Kribbella steppae]TCO26243.1 putative hydrolase of the HAD superfamily [Kribbella steppae]
MRFVVLDAMGVLYRHGNVVGGVLVPYLRDLGCTLGETDIRAVYRRCTLRLLSTDELWTELEVADRASDADYCSRHELTPGTLDTLRGLREAGFTPLVLTNDAEPWSARLRARFGLDQYVDRWFVSSEIGARKPDPMAYHAVLEHPGLEASHTVLVDDRPTNLVAARSAGFRPWLFQSEDTAAHPADAFDVPVARSMAELLTQLSPGRRDWREG